MSGNIHILVLLEHLAQLKEIADPITLTNCFDIIDQQKLKLRTLNYASNEILHKPKGHLRVKLCLFWYWVHLNISKSWVQIQR